jgi:peptide chain release factor 2
VAPVIGDAVEVEVDEKDLKVDTYRASGAGGQHVNKTDSAVRITHLPTGLVAQCQNERSQHQNREVAMNVLRARLFELEREKREREIAAQSGEKADNEWGSQIRSYVLHPYKMVKDHRTGEQSSDVDAVLDGDIDLFIYSYLKSRPAQGAA